MQLSDPEKRLVARLKKRQQQLIRWRWMQLLSGIFSIGVGIYAFIVVVHMLQHLDLPTVLFVTSVIPTIYVFFGVGTLTIVYAILYWNGKPETHLLLRLIEESPKDNALN